MPQVIDKQFRLIPQLAFCCCCTDCSLRTGALVVGWLGLTIFVIPEMILIVLVGTVVKGSPYYVERICAVACVTFEFDFLGRSADIPAWLGLMDLTAAVTYCSTVLIMSIILLIGVYEKKITLVKLWVVVVLVVWAVGVVYSSSRIILVFVFGHGNIWVDFVSSIIHIFVIPGVPLYCIVVVKSYYVEECRSLRDAYHGRRDMKAGKPLPATDLGHVLRRIPQTMHTCCCTSYTLRLGVLTAGWTIIVGLAFYIFMITVFVIESLIEGNGDQIPLWSFYGESSYIAGCVDLSFSWTIVIFLLITSVILLVGLNKGNFKVIKILLGIHVVMWFVSLVVQIMCYVATSMLFFPRFFIMAAFKIVIIQVVYGYWIVLIKSYYVAEYVQQKYGQRIDELSVSESSMAVSIRMKRQSAWSKSALTLAKSEMTLSKSELTLSTSDNILQAHKNKNEDKTKEPNRKEIEKEKTPFPGEQRKGSKSESYKKQQEHEKTPQSEKTRSMEQLVRKMKTTFHIGEEQLPEIKITLDKKQQENENMTQVQAQKEKERTAEPERKPQGSKMSLQQVQQRQQREKTVEPNRKHRGSESSQQVQQRELRETTVEPNRKQRGSESSQQVQQRQLRESTVEPNRKQRGSESSQQVQQRQLREKTVEPGKNEPDKLPQKTRESREEAKKSQGKEKTPRKES